MNNNYFFCFIRELLALFVMSICFIVPSLTVQAGDLKPVGNICFAFGSNNSNFFDEANPLILSAFSIDNKYFPIYGEYISNPISGSGLFDNDLNLVKITFTTSEGRMLNDSGYPMGLGIYMRVYTLWLNLNNEDWEGTAQLISVAGSSPPDEAPGYTIDTNAEGKVKRIPCN